MKNFTLQEELETWVRTEQGEDEFKDFSFYADTDTGDFDSEKGAMTDYKIYAKNNTTGEKYVGRGGYYNSDGHHFFSSVKFVLQEKKEKKIKNEFIPIIPIQDNDSHWYIIPQELQKTFMQLAYYDQDDKIEEFNDLFSKYMVGGCLSNYQLFISQDELKRLTGE